MQLSDQGIAFLAAHEGIVPAPYRDSVGVLTYGIGHTAAAGAPDPRSLPRGMPDDLDAALRDVFDVFRRDVARYEREVARAITRPMTQTQFDAAVSFHYNTGAIGRASWVKTFNRGDEEGAAKAMMNWRRPPEIIPRRAAERRLFRNGDYGDLRATVWGVRGDRVVWRPVRTLSASDVVALMGRTTKPTPPTTGGFWAAVAAFFRKLFGG